MDKTKRRWGMQVLNKEHNPNNRFITTKLLSINDTDWSQSGNWPPFLNNPLLSLGKHKSKKKHQETTLCRVMLEHQRWKVPHWCLNQFTRTSFRSIDRAMRKDDIFAPNYPLTPTDSLGPIAHEAIVCSFPDRTFYNFWASKSADQWFLRPLMVGQVASRLSSQFPFVTWY